MRDEMSVTETTIMTVEIDEGALEAAPPDDFLTFDEVFMIHHKAVYRYAYALLHDCGLAEDVTQEVFLRFHNHSIRAQQSQSLRAWLLRVTANVIRNQLRGRKRAELRDQEFVSINVGASHTEPPDAELSRNEDIASVRNALYKINEPMRSCLLLKHEGLSYREISKALGIKESSVGSLILRGRREFMRIFENQRRRI